jgi:hypothetical protein
MKAWTIGISVTCALWPSLALAQLRGHREPLDTTSLGVVAGLFVLGIAAYFLARGRR